jgi:hypothetical protein
MSNRLILTLLPNTVYVNKKYIIFFLFPALREDYQEVDDTFGLILSGRRSGEGMKKLLD